MLWHLPCLQSRQLHRPNMHSNPLFVFDSLSHTNKGTVWPFCTLKTGTGPWLVYTNWSRSSVAHPRGIWNQLGCAEMRGLLGNDCFCRSVWTNASPCTSRRDAKAPLYMLCIAPWDPPMESRGVEIQGNQRNISLCTREKTWRRMYRQEK